MSDRFVHPVNYTDHSNRQSVQSVWMAHWMRTSCDSAENTRNPIETKTFEIVNESLKISSKSMGNERTQSSLFNFHNLLSGKVVDGEGTSKNPIKSAKTDSDANRGIFAMPKPLQEIHVESSSQILPYGFDLEKYEFGKEKAVIVFKQLRNANMTVLDHGNDGKVDLHSQSDNDEVETMRIFRSTRVITEIKGNESSDLHGLSQFFGQGKRGLKLQLLSSSTDSDGKEDMGDVKASKITIRNELSAETNTMDIDYFKEKNNSGTFSTTSAHKAFNSTIPENTCPSSSKTQSFDINKLSANNINHPVPNSNLSLKNAHDPGHRWVKRLKLNSSIPSAHGTKGSDTNINLSHEKMSKLFSKILKSEEPKQSKKKGNELLLSHAWIQRWLSSNRSRISEKKPKPVVITEPQSSKITVEKEQFPSIAAMALMGKAITGFQPCELKKRGSFTVWNSKAF